MTITVVSGTNRANSMTINVAKKYMELLEQQDCKAKFLDLRVAFESTPTNQNYGKLEDSFEQEIESKIKGVDKFVFVFPEYNGSFPGILKYFIDLTPPPFLKGKKAGLIGVSSGRAGNIVGLDQFTTILHHLKVNVMCSKPKLSGIEQLMDEDFNLFDDFSIKSLEKHAQDLILF